MTQHTAPANTWGAPLRAAGRRVTRQRLAVLAAVDRLPHSTADDVVTAVRAELTDITLQSVYVVLSDLTVSGLLRRIEPPNSPARYETRVNDNHHHAVCTGCGRIEDVDCAVGHAPCLTPSWSPGSSQMTIQIADVVYQGLCNDCREASAEDSPVLSEQVENH